MNTWRLKKAVILVAVFVIIISIGYKLWVYRDNISSNKQIAETQEQPALPTVAPANTEVLSPKKTLPLDIMVPEGAGHIIEGVKASGRSEEQTSELQSRLHLV